MAARITLAASFSTPSSSRILPSLWLIWIFLTIGVITVGPVAVTRAPNRAAISRGISIRILVRAVVPRKVTRTPIVVSLRTLS